MSKDVIFLMHIAYNTNNNTVNYDLDRHLLDFAFEIEQLLDSIKLSLSFPTRHHTNGPLQGVSKKLPYLLAVAV